MCHREINAITCMCAYFGANHLCSKIMNGTISISSCPDKYPVCQDAIERRDYFGLRWQNEDGYTTCGVCKEKLGCRAVCEVCFCTKCHGDYCACRCRENKKKHGLWP